MSESGRKGEGTEGRSGGKPHVEAGGRQGNRGFAGYEYQVEATVWVALDLMLCRRTTEAVTIEPPSQEDVEAVVGGAGEVLSFACEDETRRLVFQVKSRSGAPWYASDFAKIVGGESREKSAAVGSRTRPMDALAADRQSRFVFITNEALTAALRAFEVKGVFDEGVASKLPGGLGVDLGVTEGKEIARRIRILAGVTEELLESRIRGMLVGCAHVAEVKHVPCLEALRGEVRRRMKGYAAGQWTRDELIEVIVDHRGSVAPTRAMDHYVPPRCLEQIERTFDGLNAVVVAGPSGTGKTLTAEMLEARLREADARFEVVGAEHGPGHVRGHLSSPGPVLFHLRDPWGGNRLLPGADRWGSDLPGLLSKAGPEKRFVVTTRSDVLRSAGTDLTKELAGYTVAIEVDDYGPERLALIYDGIAGDLSGDARVLARGYRETALQFLSRPYEIDRFLVALGLEDREKPRRAVEIVADSQIDAISRVLARQLEPWGPEGAAGAVIIWALISARGAVARAVVPTLLQAMRSLDPGLRPDVEGLMAFLEEGRNLRREGTVLSFHHPRVEEGLRLTFMAHRGEAEYVLSIVVRALAVLDCGEEDWGVETALGVLVAVSRLEGVSLKLDAAAQERVDARLVANAMGPAARGNFERAFRDLARFGGSAYVPSRLARALAADGGGGKETGFGRAWEPPELSEKALGELAGDDRTPALVGRFVREWLPFSAVRYGNGLAGLLERLAPGVRRAFWDALDTVAGPGGPAENIETIVAGACAGSSPNFDRAVERFARSEAEAREWLKGEFADDLRQAEEHEVDAVVADHVMEEPAERFYNAEAGLREVVRLRAGREGLGWVVGHPNGSLLISAAAELIQQGWSLAQQGEMQLMLGAARGWRRSAVWDAAKERWEEDLSELLSTELAEGGLGSGARRTLMNVAESRDGDEAELVAFLGEAVGKASVQRRLELVYDVVVTTPPPDLRERLDRRRVVEGLCARMPEDLGEVGGLLAAVLDGESIRDAAGRLSEGGARWLEAVLPTVSVDVTGALIGVAAAIGTDVVEAARRLLASGEAAHGLHAVQAIVMAGGPRELAVLREAVAHGRYAVRVAALEELMWLDSVLDRPLVVTTAEDRSADVRLAFARRMYERRWPEAIEALVRLLRDERDFDIDFGSGSWSRFSVARAAAYALGAYDELPDRAVAALLDLGRGRSRDPFVGCAAVSALAGREGAGIAELILESLEASGMDDAPRHRPRAQAAAWAVFDRAVAGKAMVLGSTPVGMAREDTGGTAGPLLMAIGMLGGQVRNRLVDELGAASRAKRVELVRVAAAAAGTTSGLLLEGCERTLARLAEGNELDEFTGEEREEMRQWSMGLDAEDDVQRFTAWIARTVFDLPIEEEMEDVRAFDVPGRIPLLTMRSLSPYREQVSAGSDDGR